MSRNGEYYGHKTMVPEERRGPMGDGRDFDSTGRYLKGVAQEATRDFIRRTIFEQSKTILEEQANAILGEAALSPPPFQVGDFVKLKTGTAPQQVVEVRRFKDHWSLRAEYLSGLGYKDHFGRSTATWKKSERFEFHEMQHRKKETEKMATVTLYQTLEETPRFGTFLARNSQGQIVLEMKGSGQVEAFDPKAIEVVRPYTVGVRFTQNSNSSRRYDYIAVKGSVEVGDLILHKDTGQILRVVVLDTRSTLANLKVLRGRKLLTEALPEAESDWEVKSPRDGEDDED